MLVVTEIKVVDVPKEQVTYLHKAIIPTALKFYNKESPSPITVTTEMVRGRKFVDAQGRSFIIGWSEASKKAFSLPFEVFEEQNEKIKTLQSYNVYNTKTVHRFLNATFLERLKFLFTKKL